MDELLSYPCFRQFLYGFSWLRYVPPVERILCGTGGALALDLLQKMDGSAQRVRKDGHKGKEIWDGIIAPKQTGQELEVSHGRNQRKHDNWEEWPRAICHVGVAHQIQSEMFLLKTYRGCAGRMRGPKGPAGGQPRRAISEPAPELALSPG
ncbi:hypothetical protein HJG60_008317 [Phyllostomus discolor]|uniref:Uncharacterized protein n=1 Tax=Phyllostomus discolor TaxID=89673 RepID=A0A833Z8X6_9CHIR|nr:hypothetical protein HJG60_008317 [Phyllostomus discolor]